MLLTTDRSPDIDYSEEEEESDSSEQEGSDDPLQVRTIARTRGSGCWHEWHEHHGCCTCIAGWVLWEFERLVWLELLALEELIFHVFAFLCVYSWGQYPFDDEEEVRKKKPRRKLTTGTSITRANVRS